MQTSAVKKVEQQNCTFETFFVQIDDHWSNKKTAASNLNGNKLIGWSLVSAVQCQQPIQSTAGISLKNFDSFVVSHQE